MDETNIGPCFPPPTPIPSVAKVPCQSAHKLKLNCLDGFHDLNKNINNNINEPFNYQ